MIEYIRGIVDELTPTQAIVEANGVGYAMLISLNTYSAIQGKSEVRLFVYEAIREDAYQLYGFFTRQEREIFILLLGVPGIGGQTARMVLSAFTPTDLAHIVQAEDVRQLKSVKGIGPKAAQRIVMDLKDKTQALMASASGSERGGAGVFGHSAKSRQQADEAVEALSVLGFSPAQSQKIVLGILEEQPDAAVEQIIKEALKRM